MPTLDHIMQLGLGFWGSKTLLSAIELNLFTELAKSPADAATIQSRLSLHPRATRDFLDALVSLNVLAREGDGAAAKYANTQDTAFFLDKSKPTYAGGILEMANARLYPFWGSLTEALKTGQPQNEAKTGKGGLFEVLYSDPNRLRQFLAGMTGISMGAAVTIAQKFPWSNYKTFIDVGGAQGALPVQVALAHKHLKGANFDLAPVGPIFTDYARSFNLQDRLSFIPGDFFKDPLPTADVIVMGHILHDWGLSDKKMLIKKACDSLPTGGALIIYEAIIDDARRHNAFGLLMSLNMLIETHEGFDYTGADASTWMKEAGFKQTRVEHLIGPDSMVVGIK